MFNRMPKIFWVGMAILYGWCFLFMFLEMTIPGLPLKQLFGVPACYIYNWMCALWLVNIVISYIFYKSEENREAQQQNKGA